MKNAVEFVNVSLNFGGVKALDDISFEVKEGSLFSIIGPNGAGKTSVFNCVNGIYRPTSGEIKIYDQEIADLKPDKIANLGVSRTFQNIELFENMTTLDNILIGAHKHINYGPVTSMLRTKKVKNQEDEARDIAEDVIDFLEIEEHRFSYILSLPYGIQKRIELGRALAMKPKVLLLDEPAAGMNNEETEDIARFILDIHEELGVTIILVDHDMNMVMDIASEVVAMDFGEKLFQGLPEDAAKDQKVVDAYLGVSG